MSFLKVCSLNRKNQTPAVSLQTLVIVWKHLPFPLHSLQVCFHIIDEIMPTHKNETNWNLLSKFYIHWFNYCQTVYIFLSQSAAWGWMS